MFITARKEKDYCVPVPYSIYRYRFIEPKMPDYAVFIVYSFDIEVILVYSAN